MKQILQDLSTGKTSIEDVPCPKNMAGNLLISTNNSLVSKGTEKMLIDFGKANYLQKAKQQPDKVKMVLDKIKADGLLSTIDIVRSKLDQPIPLGYCNAGQIIESSSQRFSVGDRVASNGYHAEVVSVPENLCAKIPDNVDNESAAFTVLGSIGLQGIRLIQPTLGETIVVSGLGLIGLMTVQMLKANGCQVLGIDVDSERCKIARQFGAETIDLSKEEDPIEIANNFTLGRGVDGVLITASSDSDEIIHQAAEMCRKRGRIVLVGVVGLNLRRDDFFEKEITFQVSASYGPGRYDRFYEEKGQDYPIGFVRWTEQRNFEAVLEMMSSGILDVKPLITHHYEIIAAAAAYQLLDDPKAMGILLRYPKNKESDVLSPSLKLLPKENYNYIPNKPTIGFIGAGNYASNILIPAFKKTGANLDTLMNSGSPNGVHHGKKNNFQTITTDLSSLLGNPNINTVVIATRHDSHAYHVNMALKAGKNVFVEKPLALKMSELDSIIETYNNIDTKTNDSPRLMIGFNRRFAPQIIKIKELLDKKPQPKTVIMTINAGSLSEDHWLHDIEIGGGRILGEGCHFIDLIRHLIDSPIKDFHATKSISHHSSNTDLNFSIHLSFSDGSTGIIHYLTNGGKSFPKERIEIFSGDGVLQLDNYIKLKGFNWTGFSNMSLFKQNKGQAVCVKKFIDTIISGEPAPININEIFEVAKVSIEVAESLK